MHVAISSLAGTPPDELTGLTRGVKGGTMYTAYAKSFPAGELINDRYRVVGVTSTSRTDITYEVLDEHFSGQVRRAMVLSLNPPYGRGSPRIHDRDILLKTNEARILGMLHHPGIPALHDYFVLHHTFGCLILDFLEGTNLEEVAKQTDGVLFPDRVVAWMLKTCDIVAYLHGCDLANMFRDIQPRNLMLGSDDHITLASVGVATDYNLTAIDDNVGTRGFAAPDMYAGRVDARTDIFAIGATMHALLTNTDPCIRVPFTFDQYPICALNAQARPELEAVVMRCLEYQPDERYQSVQELKTALSRLVPVSVRS